MKHLTFKHDTKLARCFKLHLELVYGVAITFCGKINGCFEYDAAGEAEDLEQLNEFILAQL